MLDLYTYMLRYNDRSFRSISLMVDIIGLLRQEINKPKSDVSDTMFVTVINITCIEVSIVRFLSNGYLRFLI